MKIYNYLYNILTIILCFLFFQELKKSKALWRLLSIYFYFTIIKFLLIQVAFINEKVLNDCKYHRL